MTEHFYSVPVTETVLRFYTQAQKPSSEKGMGRIYVTETAHSAHAKILTPADNLRVTELAQIPVGQSFSIFFEF